jgi:hypothetical protein
MGFPIRTLASKRVQELLQQTGQLNVEQPYSSYGETIDSIKPGLVTRDTRTQGADVISEFCKSSRFTPDSRFVGNRARHHDDEPPW